jgi:hypothetical protein
MSNRVVRDGILMSDAVNQLDWPEEVFFRRLLNLVDDFGRFEASTAVFRAWLYPLKVDVVTEVDIQRWLDACVRVGLIKRYSVNGKNYLEVLKFDQKLRRMIPKWPPPPDTLAKTGNRSGEHNRSGKSDG